MAAQLFQAAGDLERAPIAETSDHDRLAKSTPRDMRKESGAAVRYRLTSVGASLHAVRDARQMCLSDLRELVRHSSPEIQLLAKLLSHFGPHRA